MSRLGLYWANLVEVGLAVLQEAADRLTTIEHVVR